jgi:pimeloyl-ACP methyl ester carboxylesterase
MWGRQSPQNDQTAAAYRQAGVILMLPTLRGGNDNPGKLEGMVGEIDDIIAAANHLATLPYVDPERIYLGGHSTGGTLVMLTAAASDQFRATFAFGPVIAASAYGPGFIPVDFQTLPEWEIYIRAPIIWLGSVGQPLYVIEGSVDGNIEDLEMMREESDIPLAQFLTAKRCGSFRRACPQQRSYRQGYRCRGEGWHAGRHYRSGSVRAVPIARDFHVDRVCRRQIPAMPPHPV